MNTKLHAVADASGGALSVFMTAGPVGDDTGAAALPDALPKAQRLLGEHGDDANWFRDALEAKGIKPRIPGRKSRDAPAGLMARKVGERWSTRTASYGRAIHSKTTWTASEQAPGA